MIRKAHFFQHVPFEGLGEIKTWLVNRNFSLQSTPFFKEWEKPDLDAIDLLIIMGGPMSVYDNEKYEWLSGETELIQQAINKGKRVWGICLGAQLIAHACGASVYKNKHKEIGWFRVEKCGECNTTENLPDSFQAFHWHGDTFDIPEGSLRIFQSEACQNQGFIYKNRVLALQFHLESNVETVNKLIDNCKDELINDTYIQPENRIKKNTLACYKESNNLLFQLLDSFIPAQHP